MTDHDTTTNDRHDDLVRKRSAAIIAAASALGDPEDYTSTWTETGKPQKSESLAGAMFGKTDDGGTTELIQSGYADALVQVADYIVTGRHDRDDVTPEAMIAARHEDVDDDEVRRTIALMREARG